MNKGIRELPRLSVASWFPTFLIWHPHFLLTPYTVSSLYPHSIHRRHPHILLSSLSLVLVENSVPGWSVVSPSLPPWKRINMTQRPWFKHTDLLPVCDQHLVAI